MKRVQRVQQEGTTQRSSELKSTQKKNAQELHTLTTDKTPSHLPNPALGHRGMHEVVHRMEDRKQTERETSVWELSKLSSSQSEHGTVLMHRISNPRLDMAFFRGHDDLRNGDRAENRDFQVCSEPFRYRKIFQAPEALESSSDLPYEA
jgi:hypothetical protein